MDAVDLCQQWGAAVGAFTQQCLTMRNIGSASQAPMGFAESAGEILRLEGEFVKLGVNDLTLVDSFVGRWMREVLRALRAWSQTVDAGECGDAAAARLAHAVMKSEALELDLDEIEAALSAVER